MDEEQHPLQASGEVEKVRNIRQGLGRSRRCSTRTDENVDTVESLVMSQEDKSQSHQAVREISRDAGIHQSSVSRIIHKDLRLKCYKKRCARQLTEAQSMHALFSACNLRFW